MLSPRKRWVKKQVKLDLKKCSNQSHRNWMMLLRRIWGHSPGRNPHEGRKPNWKELIISPTSIHLKIWMSKVCLTKQRLFPPQAEKQISAAAPKGPPPTYEEIMKDSGNGPPPEYEEDDPLEDLPPVGETEEANELLTLLSILNYITVDTVLGSSEISATQKRNYLEKNILPDAIFRRNQLKGYKSSFTKKFKKGEITEEQKNWQHQRIDRSSQVLGEYIKHYKAKQKTLKGSGLRRRKKGGTVCFFSNPKELLQKLEVIIGSILAGNTNQGIRNTGVGILDLLLKENAINRFQHEKLFRKYFKP